jgi:DNA-binding IclR family transcriptional regulator
MSTALSGPEAIGAARRWTGQRGFGTLRPLFFIPLFPSRYSMRKPAKSRTKPTRKRTSGDSMPRHGIRSIVVGVSLLNKLAAIGRPATLSEIAAAAGMSPTRTHRYLLGLAGTRLVEQNPVSGRYDLGSQILELGITALGRVDAVRIATDVLTELSERTRLASLICVWGTNGPTVIRWEQADLASAVRIREGRNLPLLRSASGRVFLAYQKPAMVEPFVIRELAEWDAKQGKELGPKQIEALRDEVRRTGLGRNIGEEGNNLAALSAPVFDASGRIALCVTLISSLGSFQPDYDGAAAQELKAVAADLSRRLGAPNSGVETRA